MNDMLDSMNDGDNDDSDDVSSSAADYDSLVNLLNRLLSDLHILYIRLRNYHWNVTGVQFYVLHQLFEAQYQAVEIHIDEVAEQVRMVGGFAAGSMTTFLDLARLDEEDAHAHPSARQMVDKLLDDHEIITAFLRNDIDQVTERYEDEATADLLISVLRTLEKQAWMLRATLRQWT